MKEIFLDTMFVMPFLYMDINVKVLRLFLKLIFNLLGGVKSMSVKGKAVGHIIFMVVTPMVAVLLSLVLLAILNVTNLLLIITTIGFAIVFSDLVIYVVLHGKNKISKTLGPRNVIYYALCIGMGIVACYIIYFIAITYGNSKFEGDPFAVSLAGGLITTLVFNTIILKKFLIKNIH